MKFKIGQIVFFKSNGFYGKLIQHYNKLKYELTGFSHVGIITEVYGNDMLIHEAISSGFVATKYPKNWLQNKIDIGAVAIGEPKEKLSHTLENANNLLGNPYAWLDIASIALSFITGFRFNGITGANRLICSEAVSRILYDSSNKRIDFQSEYGKSFDLVTPMDIYTSKQVNILKNKKVS